MIKAEYVYGEQNTYTGCGKMRVGEDEIRFGRKGLGLVFSPLGNTLCGDGTGTAWILVLNPPLGGEVLYYTPEKCL